MLFAPITNAPPACRHHPLTTLPALLVTIREMRQNGAAYAAQIVANARALGKALDEEGIPVEARDFGYTSSHQIAVNVSEHGGGVPVAEGRTGNGNAGRGRRE